MAAGLVATAVTVPGGLRWALARPRLVQLGAISYGLYMFHEVAFGVRDWVAEGVGWFPFQNWFWPAAGLAITVGLALASFRFVESPFLLRKRRWTRVPSRPVEGDDNDDGPPG